MVFGGGVSCICCEQAMFTGLVCSFSQRRTHRKHGTVAPALHSNTASSEQVMVSTASSEQAMVSTASSEQAMVGTASSEQAMVGTATQQKERK